MQRLAFIHTPKTGGISLIHALEKFYDKSEIFPYHLREQVPDEAWMQAKKYKFIRGHFPFATVKQHFGEAKYITIVRDPVAREISWFYWLLYVNTTDPESVRIKHGPQLDAANKGLEYYAKTQITDGKLALQFSTNNQPNGIRSLVDSAKRNLAEEFSFIGVFEHYDLLMENLGKILGYKLDYTNLHKNPFKGRYNVTPSVINNIISRIPLDIEIYTFAKNLCLK